MPNLQWQRSDSKDAETVAYLERLSAAAVNAMSQRDWDFTKTPEAREVYQHIASDHSADFDAYPQRLTFAETIEAHRQFMQANPGAYYEVKNMTTDLTKDSRHAKIFLTISMLGMADGVSVEGIGEFRWRYTNDWYWYGHVAMRGFNADKGLV